MKNAEDLREDLWMFGAYALHPELEISARSRPARPAQERREEGVGPFLLADGRLRAVAGVTDGVVGKRQQHPGNRGEQAGRVGAGEIRPADTPGEERVPDKRQPVSEQADAPRTVARCMPDGEHKPSHPQSVAV